MLHSENVRFHAIVKNDVFSRVIREKTVQSTNCAMLSHSLHALLTLRICPVATSAGEHMSSVGKALMIRVTQTATARFQPIGQFFSFLNFLDTLLTHITWDFLVNIGSPG